MPEEVASTLSHSGRGCDRGDLRLLVSPPFQRKKFGSIWSERAAQRNFLTEVRTCRHTLSIEGGFRSPWMWLDVADDSRFGGQSNQGDEDPLDARHNLHFNRGSVQDVVATSVSLFEAKQGLEQLLLEELRTLVRLSRREVGCLVFDVYRIAGRSSTYALHEVWEMREAMEAHARNVHTTRFRIGAEKYLAHPIDTLELEELM